MPIDQPFASYKDIADFFDDFKDNLEKVLHKSFMTIKLVDPFDPYHFNVLFRNGSEIKMNDIDINLALFNHLTEMTLSSSFYVINDQSQLTGCTRWNINTQISHSKGSYAFTATPKVSRDTCPNTVGTFTDQGMHPILKKLAFCLFVLSILTLINLVSSLVARWKLHVIWGQTDTVYKDLPIYDQIHLSLGFWHPLHFVVSAILFAASIVLMIEVLKPTQFISVSALWWFAVAFFLSFATSCRWFVYLPKMYQLINVVRVSFTRLLSITIGMMPLVLALMFISLFLFGLVSDIPKTYIRFFQLFIGTIFGDDLFNVYTYFTDGTDMYTALSFLYVTVLAIVATYIVFPAFTATISFLHHNEVIPPEERIDFY